MSKTSLPLEWLEQLFDPYAVLGVSVNADERQIVKRYYALAKLLHPDNYTTSQNQNGDLANHIFTHLINPAYAPLKHKQKRLNVLIEMRFQASNVDKQQTLYSSIIQQLTSVSTPEAELFYEQAIATHAETQYKLIDQSYQVTKLIHTLNLAYLSLHKHRQREAIETDFIIPPVEDKSFASASNKKTHVAPVLTNYAQRHYERGLQYTKQANWTLAVQELRDAIKLDPSKSDYYALLGVVHWQQKFPGMARVYIRQALKLNPQQPLALEYAVKLQIDTSQAINPQSMGKAVSIAAKLSSFLFKQR